MAGANRNLIALRTLHYLTPVLALVYYVCARTLAACLLHRPVKRSGEKTRRLGAIALLLAIITTLVAQAITYFIQTLTQPDSWARQDCVLYILASVFAYGLLTLYLLETKRPLWHPVLGSCFIAAALETSTTVFQALAEPANTDILFGRLALQVVRCLLLVSLCTFLGWHALQDRSYRVHSRDDTQPLLPNGADGSAVKNGYGAVPEREEDSDDDDSSSGDSDDEEPDHVKELKEQQRKRLKQSGNWLSYLKEYKIFIPMLLPKKDRYVQACLVTIGVVLIAERVLNVLVPYQLGLITDDLARGNGNGVIPWRDVSIWMLLSWLNSRAGIYMIKSIAELPVEQYAYKQLGVRSFAHIMGLSMDFHNEKQSGELIRAINQGQNMTGMLEFMFFQIAPTFVDLFIAFVYVYVLFDVYMSYILLCIGIAYVWVGAKTTAWSIKRRRKFNTAHRNESKVQNEAIVNWQTVSHFNRGQYECDKYTETITKFNSAELSYYYAYYIGGGAQSLIMVLGRLSATFLAIYRISQGDVPVGRFVTLITYWRSIESPLSQVSWSIRRVTSMLTDSERLLQLFQTKPTVTDAPDAVQLYIKSGQVKFQDVDFAYDSRKTDP